MKQVRTPYLFVYGTLKPSHPSPASRALKRMGAKISASQITGTMYRIGWYPAIKLHGRGRPIKGDVIQLKSPKAIDFLDKYEGAHAYGNDYCRQMVRVPVRNAKPVLASVYVYLPCTTGLSIIKSGLFV
jgi:gamma-glutamylcyclotransferase (GGCT)/AIG2-like uncharacterized protein YtfP